MLEDFLSTVPIFSDLSSEELNKISKLANQRDYPKGSMIIFEE